jgi:hypothetical protein
MESKFAADEFIFSSTPDLSFIFSSMLDLSMLFTYKVLFIMYFEFYQHSMPVISSNQILGILEIFNKYQYELHYTIMDLLPVEYAVLLTRKSDIDRGEAKVNI